MEHPENNLAVVVVGVASMILPIVLNYEKFPFSEQLVESVQTFWADHATLLVCIIGVTFVASWHLSHLYPGPGRAEKPAAPPLMFNGLQMIVSIILPTACLCRAVGLLRGTWMDDLPLQCLEGYRFLHGITVTIAAGVLPCLLEPSMTRNLSLLRFNIVLTSAALLCLRPALQWTALVAEDADFSQFFHDETRRISIAAAAMQTGCGFFLAGRGIGEGLLVAAWLGLLSNHCGVPAPFAAGITAASALVAVLKQTILLWRAAREALARAAELRRIVETAHAPIFGVDRAFRINEWNGSIARATGFTKAEAMGRDLVQDFVVPAQRDAVRAVLRRALAGDETGSQRVDLLTKGGAGVRQLVFNATVRLGSDKQPAGVVGVAQDDTHRRCAEQHAHRSGVFFLYDAAAAAAAPAASGGRSTMLPTAQGGRPSVEEAATTTTATTRERRTETSETTTTTTTTTPSSSHRGQAAEEHDGGKSAAGG